MSAELFDAEMAGAVARPAVDVLPTHGRKVAPAAEPAPEEPPAAPAVPAPAAAGAVPVVEVTPAAPDDLDAEAPRRFFGMQLRRHRKDGDETGSVVGPVAESGGDASDASPWPVEPAEPTLDASVAESSAEAEAEVDDGEPSDPVQVATVAVEPAASDPSQELRALHALLDASEQQRAAAEARAAQAIAYAQQAQTAIQQAQAQAQQQAQTQVEQAQAKARAAANDAQDWQIRHREADATIAELAGSLANAEQRVGDLRGQLEALTAERDELLAALEDATSPDHATHGA